MSVCAAHSNRSFNLSTGWVNTWNDAGIHLIQYKEITALFLKNSTRVRSARAHSQQCTTTAGNMDTRVWGVVWLNLDGEFWRCSIFTALWMMCIAVNSKWCFWSKLVQTAFFGVKCMSAQSIRWILKLLLQIALKWCVLQLASEWCTLSDECGWVAGWWSLGRLTQFEWFLLAWLYCFLQRCVLRLTVIYKKLCSANRTAVKWGVLYLSSNDYQIYG